MVIWLEMVSLHPAKPTIISFLCLQFKPTIDVYKPLYKSNVVNAGLLRPEGAGIYIRQIPHGHGITFKYGLDFLVV